ncbi:MAG: hypothetical protein OEV78_12460 [Spirochaetia bacterium]|nr:hypothetical protein [Spirochaetia bacterium]
MKMQDNILNFEKFKLKKFLEVRGYQWFEDKNGKFKIWIRKAGDSSKKTSGLYTPKR